MEKDAVLPVIENKIYEIRGIQVMFDFDLAEMYDVQTKRLKEQVRRNIDRFPSDFMFQLTKTEWTELVANCDQLPESIRHSSVAPFAFTQEGVAMLSGILRSPKAIQVNIIIMRAFVSVRKYLAQVTTAKSIQERVKALEEANEELLKDINDLSEDTSKGFDELFDAFAKLSNEVTLAKTKPPRNPIGYTAP
jgi:preprotein translocase subunit SecA